MNLFIFRFWYIYSFIFYVAYDFVFDAVKGEN